MSNNFFLNKEKVIYSTRNKPNKKILINAEKNKMCRIESANTNFSTNSQYNLIKQKINYVSQSNLTDNSFKNTNYSFPKKKYRKLTPKWKYSYYLDKNDILSLNNKSNNPEIKNTLCDFKDIDIKPKPIVYSWTKPKMVKIIENNANIEEEVKSHFWKYSDIFEKKDIKPPGKLIKIIMTQLSHCYGRGLNFIDINKNGITSDDRIFNDKISYNQQWKVPGTYRNNTNNINNYEPIKKKRPRTAFHY